MRFIKGAFPAILTVATTMISIAGSEAAPLPTNVGAMRATLDNDVVKVRYGGWGYRGGWGGGYRGAGLGYRGLGYRGAGYGYRGYGYRGYRGWGAGAVVAGAVVGGAIASSGYYGAYPSYGDGYSSYGGGTAMNIVRPVPTAPTVAMAVIAATMRGGATIPAGRSAPDFPEHALLVPGLVFASPESANAAVYCQYVD
ncbi:hypothetical protein ABIB80_002660 [Bradyrhizobium sp. i1.15.2]